MLDLEERGQITIVRLAHEIAEKNNGSENETAKFQRSSCCNQPQRIPRAAALATRPDW